MASGVQVQRYSDVLRPQIEDQLIPPEQPDPAEVNRFVEQFMQIAHQQFGVVQCAQPAQSASQSPASISPATNVSIIPSQQPVALEPSLLNYILQIFQSAIETFCAWFSSFITYCSSLCHSSSEIVAELGQLQTPAQPPLPAQAQGQSRASSIAAVVEPIVSAVIPPQALEFS